MNCMMQETKTSFIKYSDGNAVIEDCTGILREGDMSGGKASKLHGVRRRKSP